MKKNVKASKKNTKRLVFFKFCFSLSILIGLSSLGYYFYSSLDVSDGEELSDVIISSYNVSRLYPASHLEQFSKRSDDAPLELTIDNEEEFSVIGVLKIAKLNLEYPILSRLNDDLLKISPCRFHGPLPGEARQYMYSWSQL